MNEKDPNQIFGFVFAVSSVAGLASLLRSSQPLTTRNVLSAFLNSGMFGLGVAVVWYEYYGGAAHPWFMIGISLLAGLGGTSMLDFAIQLAQSSFTSYASRIAAAAPLPNSLNSKKEGV